MALSAAEQALRDRRLRALDAQARVRADVERRLVALRATRHDTRGEQR